MVVRRPITASTASDVLNRLLGNGAVLKLGSQAGGEWTDLSRAVRPPPVAMTQTGVTRFRTDDGGRGYRALAEVPGFAWVVWVEFPETTILAPAYVFLRQMIGIGLFVVIVAGAVVRVMTSRITTPLSELTRASEAMAAGEHARRVSIDRQDEIGRLGTAFNGMTAQVERAHSET